MDIVLWTKTKFSMFGLMFDTICESDAMKRSDDHDVMYTSASTIMTAASTIMTNAKNSSVLQNGYYCNEQ